MKKGWNVLLNARKQHFFIDGRSLCNRWLCLGSDYTAEPDPRYPVCCGCVKKLEKRKEKRDE